MIDKNTLITVTNRQTGTVGYKIPDLGNLHRNFQPNETKEITMEELRKLSYMPGGKYILKNCLIISNEEAIKELLNNNVEPEYFYTEDEVKNLLLNGSLDALKDCLDFAPTGVIDLVKKLAVSLEINDISKRDAIKEKTGFNVTSAIEINKETKEENEEVVKTRRVEPVSTAKTNESGRRTAPPKYKITTVKSE